MAVCRLLSPLLATLLSGLLTVEANASPLESGKPLKVGVNGGVGCLASPNAYLTYPLGAARVTGGARPDLFVNAPRGIEVALYLYAYQRDDADGVPIFAPPVKIAHPFGDKATPGDGVIVTDHEGVAHGFWFVSGELVRCRYDPAQRAFVRVGAIKVPGLPRAPMSVAVSGLTPDAVRVVVACADRAGGAPEGDRGSDDYAFYNSAGKYRGTFVSAGLYRFAVSADLAQIVEEPTLASPREVEVRAALQVTALPRDGAPDGLAGGVLAGSRFGNLFYFPAESSEPGKLAAWRPVMGPEGVMLRHPTVGMDPFVYPRADGSGVDLIVGGEGPLYYYRYAGLDDAGNPRYAEPTHVWQEDADVYAGSLAIPTAVDWDGDGAQDLIVGNSEGVILFFKNHGTTASPKFGLGEPVDADGKPIHIQPGYFGIQGPGEARWGYTSPAVADWNGDGLLDLFVTSSAAEHLVYMNRGTRTQPRLDAGQPLYWDGLELHGMWRIKAGVAKFGDRMAYVFQDDDNALRRMWRVDDHNVTDDGLLLTTDGRPITTHPAEITGQVTAGGQKGRTKINLVDWDSDGVLDLILGTARRGSVPYPENGLPSSRHAEKVRSLQVLFLRNAGSNAHPAFEFPRQFTFRGKDLYLGAHENGPAPCDLGDTSDGQNLVIGMESGRIYFYQRRDLTYHQPGSRTVGDAAANPGDAGE